VPQNRNFAYQTLAAQMRGFRTNIRNGQSYLLANTELRIPILRYFKEDWRSNIWKNMQLVGFFDVGTAWHGLNPFGKDNPLNTVSIINPDSPISIKVNYFRDPIIAGYGAGIHTTILGYFVKIDKAWGIETQTAQAPIWHFSLGTDF
jgi:outer membrane protein assembly factor BamA